MDLPNAPDDLELRNIIDKLAQFVARNGPEFEQMTKNKQAGNPKFYFLFGGEHYHYYQFRVSSERSMLNGQEYGLPPNLPSSSQSGPPPHHHLNNAFFSQQQQQHQPSPQSHQLPPQMFSQLPPPHHQQQPQFPPRFPPPNPNGHFHLQMTKQHSQTPPTIPQNGLYGNREPFVPSSLSSSITQPQISLPPPPSSSVSSVHPTFAPNLTSAPQQPQMGFNAWPTPPHAYPPAMNQTPLPVNDNFANNVNANLKPQDNNNNTESITNNVNESEILEQIKELRDQMADSEKNLSSQHQVITEDDKQKRIEELITKLLDDELKRMCEDFDINLNEFDKILQPIIDTCRKESIANGKVWIFNNCYINEHYEAAAKHLLKRVTRVDSSFEAKLHLMYLINDLYNHCMRKGDDRLKDAINQIIVPSFSTAVLEASDDKKQKMNKLLKLWEMNQYLDNSLLDQLKTPQQSLDAYKTSLYDRFSNQIKTVTDEQTEKYNKLEMQHKEFVEHQETKIEQLLQKQKQSQQPPPFNPNTPQSQAPSHFPPGSNSNLFHGPPSHMAPGQMPPMPPHLQSQMPHQLYPPLSNPSQLLPPPLSSAHPFPPQPGPTQSPLSYPPSQGGPIPPQPNSHILPNFYQNSAPGQAPGPAPFPSPGGGLPPPMHFGQLPPSVANSAPGPLPEMPTAFPPSHPSQFNPPPPNNEEVKVPYFDLPAGIMTQLIKLEDFDYNPINPKDIRMPAITPPSERLLQAIEAFYAPPSHEHPRNAEGWEKLGLYEFFKAKSQSRKECESKTQSNDNFKEDNDESNDINNSNSSTFSSRTADDRITDPQTKSIERRSPSPPKRRYKEFKEESPGGTIKTNMIAAQIQPRRSRSRSSSRSRDRRNKSRHSRSKSRSRSRSRSPHRSSRNRSRSRSPYSKKSRSKRRSRSISPIQSHPSYSLTPVISQADSKLNESNKGHQLLKKMGWSGSGGLGSNEQGLQEPIPSGEVREKSEQFHGVGIAPSGFRSDPFESFRRNKGQAYIQRIRDGRRD